MTSNDPPRDEHEEPAPRDGAAPHVAIIGAGVAGIRCAQVLKQSGLTVTLFEKSHGPGGRLATRRNDAGDHFDHGAQYITCRSDDFAQWLETLREDGSMAAWEPELADAANADHHPWLVGTPGMNALLKPRSRELDIRTQTTVSALQRLGRRWQLIIDDGSVLPGFDVVIITAPCPQARALLAVDPALQSQLDAVTIDPCWALMISFSEPLPVGFDARRFETGATGWLARQASRPGHDADGNAWVLHASARWSADHLERDASEIAELLQQDLRRIVGQPLPGVTFVKAHRWRYALTTRALGQPFIANADSTLFAAGDWCLGARVECAYESGVTVAHAVAKAQRTAR